jgi:hypothetical protein
VKEIAQELGIDIELVARDLNFHRGVGRGYQSQIEEARGPGRSEAAAFAATAFRRAGSHALLLDEVKLARRLFADSAKCYDRLHRPYSAMMWTLARNLSAASKSSDRSLFEFARSEGKYPPERFGQLAYSLLIEGAGEAGDQDLKTTLGHDGRFRRAASELTALAATPLGMMGIPMASYLNLAASMEGDANPRDVLYRLLPFLNAYELALETARSKAYHWRRLLMPFHPAEPDILSVLFVCNTWFKRHGLKLTDLLLGRDEYRYASKLSSDALERVEE